MSSESSTFKIILVGDSQCGKSSLANKICYDSFTSTLPQTVGVATFVTTIEIDNHTVEFKIWDTAGQETYAKLLPVFIRGANACIIVADITNKSSIEHINDWRDEVTSCNSNPVFIVAFNKVDLVNEIGTVFNPLMEQFSNEYSHIFAVSAKDGTGVFDLFECAGRLCLNQLLDNKVVTSRHMPELNQNKNDCC